VTSVRLANPRRSAALFLLAALASAASALMQLDTDRRVSVMQAVTAVLLAGSAVRLWRRRGAS
jgi:hypothetical protein